MHTQQTIYAGPESWKRKKERDTSPPSSFDIFQFGISPTQNTISSLSVALKLVCVPFLSFDSFLLLLPPFFVCVWLDCPSIHHLAKNDPSHSMKFYNVYIRTSLLFLFFFYSARLWLGCRSEPTFLFYFIFLVFIPVVCEAGLTLFFFCFFPGRRPREEPGRVRHPPVRERSSTGPKINNNNKVDENF